MKACLFVYQLFPKENLMSKIKTHAYIFTSRFKLSHQLILAFWSGLRCHLHLWEFQLMLTLWKNWIVTRICTGCPAKLITLFYKQFLGQWCTKDFYLRLFSIALSVGCSKLFYILKIEQYLTKLWRKYWQRNKTKSNKIHVQLKFFFAVYFLQFSFSLINEYNDLNLIVLYLISLIQWFSIVFNIHYTSVDFIYLTWNSLPPLANRKEHFSQSNVVNTKNAIPPYRTQSPPDVPPWKEIVKTASAPLRKLEM